MNTAQYELLSSQLDNMERMGSVLQTQISHIRTQLETIAEQDDAASQIVMHLNEGDNK